MESVLHKNICHVKLIVAAEWCWPRKKTIWNERVYYGWQYDPEKNKYKVGVIDESLLTGGDV